MNLLQKWRENEHSSLLENTVMLYILQFSSIFLSFLTQGYQARVLGMAMLGTLGTAQYITNFFQYFIDFGFLLSATGEVSRVRHDKRAVSHILSSVIAARMLFILISYGILFLFIRPTLADGKELLTYVLFLLGTSLNSLLPDFIYRGLEQMSTITIRAVSLRVFATVMVFLFIRQPGDYYMVPLFIALGNVGAIVYVYWHLFTKVGVHFCPISPRDVWLKIRNSFQFFVSQVVTAVNSNTNGIILKTTLGPTAAGVYTNADKIITAAKSAMSPISDSLYPHMMNHRDFRIIKKAMLFIYPVILLGCALVYVLAPYLLVIWLGEEGAQVVTPLRILLPVAAFTFPNYLLGYPTLGAMGLSHVVNLSSILSSVLYLVGMGILYLTGSVTLVTLCALTSCAELFVLLMRLTVIFKNRHLMHRDAPQS